MDLNPQDRVPKQPPAGFQLLDAGQSVARNDISRSPITDMWDVVNNETEGHVVSRINARHNIFARAIVPAGACHAG